jgi:hypothetical protein
MAKGMKCGDDCCDKNGDQIYIGQTVHVPCEVIHADGATLVVRPVHDHPGGEHPHHDYVEVSSAVVECCDE